MVILFKFQDGKIPVHAPLALPSGPWVTYIYPGTRTSTPTEPGNCPGNGFDRKYIYMKKVNQPIYDDFVAWFLKGFKSCRELVRSYFVQDWATTHTEITRIDSKEYTYPPELPRTSVCLAWECFMCAFPNTKPRFLEYKRLRQQAILGHAFFHPPFSKNILIWSKMTYYEGGKNNFSPSEAIWGLK